MPISMTDRAFLVQCEAVKRESHDPDRQVGALIVNHEGTVIATGSNRPLDALGLTIHDSHREITNDPDWKYFMLEHAERNAINDARNHNQLLTGTTMYGTLFPCADCARAIVAAGIKRLVVPTPNSEGSRDEKWRSHYEYSRRIFDLSGIHLDFVKPLNQSDT